MTPTAVVRTDDTKHSWRVGSVEIHRYYDGERLYDRAYVWISGSPMSGKGIDWSDFTESGLRALAAKAREMAGKP